MAQEPSIKQICKLIWQLEKSYQLLDYEVHGVKIWQYCRMLIYYELATKAGLFKEPHQYDRSLKTICRRALSAAKGLTTRNPLWPTGKKEIIVISHPRSNDFQGTPIDIYTHFFVEELLKKNRSVMVIDPSFEDHTRHDHSYVTYYDIFSLAGRVKAALFPARINGREKSFFKKIEKIIDLEMNISINLVALLELYLNFFLVRYTLFKWIFFHHQPKQVYVVIAYAHGAMIRAANEMGIEVIEFQHGIISPYHLGYSFPDADRQLAYFPDKIFCWGDFWRQSACFPIEKDHLINYGFAYFNILRCRYPEVKHPHQVLVLSQGSIGEKLMNFMVDAMAFMSEFKVIYKLHPGEYAVWKTYPDAGKLSEFRNVTVAQNVDLYHIMASSRFQIGVNSTTIYEGLGFGCLTVLVNLPGIEYMDSLILKKHAFLCRNPETLKSSLDKAENLSKRVDPAAFFEKGL
jgi:hypothetical protein